MLFVAAALALAVGIVLGMLGGGGAILTLPLLVYVLGVEPRAAIATSLFVVGATAVVGATLHGRAGAVKWRLGLTFGAAAMAGAFAGGRLAHLVPATLLLVLFGIVMLVTAVAMLRRRKDAPDGDDRPLQLSRALPIGVGVGVLSGLVGAGGGFLIVPALTLFCGVAMREAIGTSLFVIALQSFAGFGGQISHVALDWQLATVVTGAAVLGAVAGAAFAKRVSVPGLRRGFAFLVLAMGLFVLTKEVRGKTGLMFPLFPLLPTVTRADDGSSRRRRPALRS